MTRINNNLSDQERDEIVDLYNRGDAIKEIINAYELKGPHVLYGILHERNVPLRSELEPTRWANVTNKKAKPQKPTVITYTPVDNVEELFERVERKEDGKGNKKFRVTIKVRLEITADTMEGAIAKAKGYNGFNEVLTVSRIG